MQHSNANISLHNGVRTYVSNLSSPCPLCEHEKDEIICQGQLHVWLTATLLATFMHVL